MAWLYVPGLEVSNSDSDSPSETTTDVFVTSSGKGSLRPRSWAGWKTRPWIARLSGTISNPSMADRGAAEWMSSLPDTHASRSASPVNAAEPTTSGISGHTSPASSEKSIQRSSFSKTSQDIYLSDSRKSFPTWKAWTVALRRVCSQRQKSATRTGERDSTLWPTPRASPNENRNTRSAPSHGKTHGKTLSGEAIKAMWATPSARDWKSGHASADTMERNARPLNEQACHNSLLAQLMKQAGAMSSDVGPNSLRLSPPFVEWLMGLPVGWTGSGCSATAWSHWRQQMRSSLSTLPCAA